MALAIEEAWEESVSGIKQERETHTPYVKSWHMLEYPLEMSASIQWGLI